MCECSCSHSLPSMVKENFCFAHSVSWQPCLLSRALPFQLLPHSSFLRQSWSQVERLGTAEGKGRGFASERDGLFPGEKDLRGWEGEGGKGRKHFTLRFRMGERKRYLRESCQIGGYWVWQVKEKELLSYFALHWAYILTSQNTCTHFPFRDFSRG